MVGRGDVPGTRAAEDECTKRTSTDVAAPPRGRARVPAGEHRPLVDEEARPQHPTVGVVDAGQPRRVGRQVAVVACHRSFTRRCPPASPVAMTAPKRVHLDAELDLDVVGAVRDAEHLLDDGLGRRSDRGQAASRWVGRMTSPRRVPPAHPRIGVGYGERDAARRLALAHGELDQCCRHGHLASFAGQGKRRPRAPQRHRSCSRPLGRVEAVPLTG